MLLHLKVLTYVLLRASQRKLTEAKRQKKQDEEKMRSSNQERKSQTIDHGKTFPQFIDDVKTSLLIGHKTRSWRVVFSSQ